MSKLLYILGNRLYLFSIKIASLWNTKARLWVNGRKNWKATLTTFTQQNTAPIVWMHCASLGEFEQGRTVFEAFKKNYKQYKFVLTFFSPSGYEIRKNYSEADLVLYLPQNTKNNATFFVTTLQPTLVIWVKYDYWNNYLLTLQQQNIPTLLIAAKFNSNQPFFKPYGAYWVKLLASFKHIFVQDEASITLLQSIAIKHCSIGGDTRFDRVVAIANELKENENIEQFCNNQQVIIAGSTWLEDEEEICHYANNNPHLKFIIAPHDVQESRVQEVEKLFKNAIRFSNYRLANTAENSVLIIDNIGLLSTLYKYATLVYIGGGFNASGIHNILEAAVYGKPILFGPTYEKFKEAIDLVESDAAFTIDNAMEFEQECKELLQQDTLYTTACSNAYSYVQTNKGATAIIENYVVENRLLTKL